MSADIIKKLKTLKSVTPSPEWKKSNRQLLMMAIKEDAASAADKTWAQELVKILFPWRVLKLAFRPALTLVAMLGLVLGSGLSVSASQTALPGDTLYSLKLATEKVQVALTFKKEEQAKVHLELAGRRISEVKKIKENSLPAQHKNQKINIAIDKFQQEITTAQTKLETLKTTGMLKPAVVEVAQIVNKKIDEYHEVLAETTVDPEVSGEVAEKIVQGLTMVEKLSEQAKQIVEVAMANENNEEVIEPETNAECVMNCDVGAEQNTNTESTDETNTNSSDGTGDATNTNTVPENTNTILVSQKIYVKPVVPVKTNENTNTEPEQKPEAEVIDESQLKVGIDLRQEITE